MTTTTRRPAAPATREARAEQSMSFGDIESAVYQALLAALPKVAIGSQLYDPDIWIRDLGSDWVVWQSYDPPGGMFQVGYSIAADSTVTLTGDPVEVNQVTSFVPVERAKPAPRTRARRRTHRDLARAGEFRQVRASIELRSAGETGGEIVLQGTPIAYDAPYDVRDAYGVFRETMHPGVAAEVLRSATFDCRFLINHEGMPLARSTSGTLEFEDTPTGLNAVPHLDARSQAAQDLAVAVERGDVTQMSCGFVVAADGDEWKWGDDGTEERDVHAFSELFDVSAVTYPASPTTSIEIAQRMLRAQPIESRERIRRAWQVAKEIRKGTQIRQVDGEMLMGALEALHTADDVDLPAIVEDLETVNDALDAGQQAISDALGVDDPDGDPADLQPALTTPAGKLVAEKASDDARARQRARLQLERTRVLLAK